MVAGADGLFCDMNYLQPLLVAIAQSIRGMGITNNLHVDTAFEWVQPDQQARNAHVVFV
jgi:hypothetical protein